MIDRVVRIVRAALFAAMTLAVLAAGPWLLLHFFADSLPRRVPDRAVLRDWFDHPSSHLLDVVVLVMWAGWALLVYVVILETYAAIRRIRVPRIRLATPLHGVAASVIGATATALSTTSAAAHGAPLTTGAVAATATVVDPQLASALSEVPQMASLPAGSSYQVARGDHLAAVAERFLGDARAYPRLRDLNPELQTRDPRFPDHIEAGWRVQLPPDAHDRGARPHATGILHTPAPAAASPVDEPLDEPQPTGAATSTYPYPDRDHELDADHLDGPAKVGVMSGAGLLASLVLLALQAERRRQTQHRRPGQRLPSPRGGTTERDLRVAEAPADLERLDLALRHLATNLTQHHQPPDILAVRVTGGDVQILLAEPADTPPEPWLDEGTQWVLPGTTPLLILPASDRPLPALTAVGSRSGRHLLLDLERHRSVSITGDPGRGLDLLRYMACELACNTWSFDAEITVVGLPEQEAEQLKQLNPGRIHIAQSLQDTVAQLHRQARATRQALDALNLPDTLTGRVRGIAVDAWVPHILIAADPDPDQQALLAALHHELIAAGRCGVAVVTALTGPPIADAVLNIDDTGVLTVSAATLRATTDTAGLTAAELDKVAEILRLARTTDLPAGPTGPAADEDALVVAAITSDPPAAAEPDLDSDEDSGVDDLVRSLYDPTLWTPGADAPELDLGSEQPEPASVPHQRPAHHDLDPTLDDDLTAWHLPDSHAFRIGILGPVTVTTAGPPIDYREDFHAEMIVYLAAHPRGVDRWQLADAIWPDRDIAESSVRVATARVRRWLGTTPDGEPWLPEAKETSGIYRLRPGHLLDWALFQRLRNRAAKYGPDGIDDLHAALNLIRGRPLHGAEHHSNRRNHYTWVGATTIAPIHLLATITDTAHQLAQLHLDLGDTAAARWAVHQAWSADPDRTHDEPWLDLIHAELIDGNRAAHEQLQHDLVRARDGEVPEDLAPATYQRLQRLQFRSVG